MHPSQQLEGMELSTHSLSLLHTRLLAPIVSLWLSFENSSTLLLPYSTKNIIHNITVQCFSTVLHLEVNMSNY